MRVFKILLFSSTVDLKCSLYDDDLPVDETSPPGTDKVNTNCRIPSVCN